VHRPLLLTEDPLLLEDLLRLAARAGTEVDVHPSVAAAGPAWRTAPLVVVGPDAARAAGVPRRPGVVLVATDGDDDAAWGRAAALGAEQVVFLPDADAWLVDLLAEARPVASSPPVLGVVGGCGGGGATTLAVALATAAARRGSRALLLDADPAGGGLDLAAGLEGASGPRWTELTDLASGGRLAGPARLRSLPGRGGLLVLSCDRPEQSLLPPEAMTAVLDDAVVAADVIVVDLPRCLEVGAAAVALARCTTVLLVLPAGIRAAAAASTVAARAGAGCPDVRLVVRAAAGSTDPVRVAAGLRLPVAATLRPEPGLDHDYARGQGPGGRRRSPLGRVAARLIAELAPLDAAAHPAA